MRRRQLLLGLAATGTLGPAVSWGQVGGAGVGPVRDLAWTDTSRQRELPLRLRLPASEGRVPLVLFSHGLGGSVDAGTQWAQAWARLGIATLHLQHPGSDRDTLRSGLRELRQAASGQQLMARATDVRFVLDELARRQRSGEPDLARLNLDAIGLAGHSFGAHTTLAIAGQAFGRGGALDSLADPRPRAFAAFSPSPGHERRSDPARAFGGIRRPVLCLTGSLDGDPFARGPGGAAERDGQGAWRRAVYDALPAGDKAELWLDGADHMSFGGQDIARPGGGAMSRAIQRPAAALEPQARHRALIEATSSAWWWAQLAGDNATRAALARPPEGLGPRDEWRRG